MASEFIRQPRRQHDYLPNREQLQVMAALAKLVGIAQDRRGLARHPGGRATGTMESSDEPEPVG